MIFVIKLNDVFVIIFGLGFMEYLRLLVDKVKLVGVDIVLIIINKDFVIGNLVGMNIVLFVGIKYDE